MIPLPKAHLVTVDYIDNRCVPRLEVLTSPRITINFMDPIYTYTITTVCLGYVAWVRG